MEETLNEMLTRVGMDFNRRAKALDLKASGMDHDPRNQAIARARAATWRNYSNYAYGKGVFPINGSDPELTMIFRSERAKAMKENAIITLGKDPSEPPLK